MFTGLSVELPFLMASAKSTLALGDIPLGGEVGDGGASGGRGLVAAVGGGGAGGGALDRGDNA